MKTTQGIIALFAPVCTSTIDFPGGVFNGCGDVYEGEHLGYTYRSNWKGINDRFSVITSPEGEPVAKCDTCFTGLWFLLEGAPEWLLPLGEEMRVHDEEQSRLYAERVELELAKRAGIDEFNRLKANYRGTRLGKFLKRIGKGHLAHLM